MLIVSSASNWAVNLYSGSIVLTHSSKRSKRCLPFIDEILDMSITLFLLSLMCVNNWRSALYVFSIAVFFVGSSAERLSVIIALYFLASSYGCSLLSVSYIIGSCSTSGL